MANATTPVFPSLSKGLTPVFAAVLSTQLLAQGGPPPNELLRMDSGHVSAALGDLDGDGISEIITGDSNYSRPDGTRVYHGIVHVHSGASGALLYTIEGENSYDAFGNAVANAGDTNLDGVSDFIVGAMDASPNGLTSAGSAYLYSGADGSLLHVFHGHTAYGDYGFSVAGAGDTDNDGYADVVIGDPYDTFFGGAVGAGYAEVRSGQDGTIQRTINGTSWELVGFAVGYAGDVDNDGFDDVYITSPAWDNGAAYDAGRFQVYSGRLWTVLREFHGDEAGMHFGHSVATGADLDGDTHDDYLIGAPLAAPASTGFVQTGAVYAYSVTGPLIREIAGENFADQFGHSVAVLQDLNGDGYGECLIGAPMTDPNSIWQSGSAYLYSGIDGSQMARVDGVDYYHEFGHDVGACTDLNGDGLNEFLISAEHNFLTTVHGRTSAWSWEANPYLRATASQLSAAAGGAVEFEINFPFSEAGFNYMLVGSASGTGPTTIHGVSIPLTADWLSTLMSGPNPPAVFQNSQGLLNHNGDAAAQLNLPPGMAAAYVGTTFQFAAVSIAAPLVRLSSMALPLSIMP